MRWRSGRQAFRLCAPVRKAAVRDAGVTLYEQAPVEQIEPEGRMVAIRARQQTYKARKVLLATGAWARQMSVKMGCPLPIRVRINTVSVTERMPQILGGVIGHATGLLPGASNIYVLCCVRGGYTIGPYIGQLMGDFMLDREPELALFAPGRLVKEEKGAGNRVGPAEVESVLVAHTAVASGRDRGSGRGQGQRHGRLMCPRPGAEGHC